jgi:hypothetical protein
MSIKNPHKECRDLNGDIYYNSRYEGFNEGVKAAVQYLEGKIEKLIKYHEGDDYYSFDREGFDDCMEQIHKELGI